MKKQTLRTPKEIYQQLDLCIINQDAAKKAVAIASVNRNRRMALEPKYAERVTPKNILIMGSTGVGKTEIARALARILNAPFINVALSQYTEVGYHGGSVPSIINDIVEKTIEKRRRELQEELKKQEIESVYEKIAKTYIRSNPDAECTIEDIMAKIKSGSLKDQEVSLDNELNEDAQEKDIQEFQLAIIPVMTAKNPFLFSRKNKKKKVTIEKAISILLDQEVYSKISEEDLIEDAIKKVEQEGIVFLDEIDKIISSKHEGNSRGDVSREGVQKDLIPIVEGTSVQTRYGFVKTDYILFIAAGAFHTSNPEDLMSEIKGRFPIKVKMNNLTEEDFVKIMTDVEFGLLEQYIELLKVDNIELSFTEDGIREIAKLSYGLNLQGDNIGARRLNQTLEAVLENILFEGAGKKKKIFSVDKSYVLNVSNTKSILEFVNLKKFNI